MSKRDNNLIIEDMLEALIKIKNYVHDYTYEDFIYDDKTIDAVVRNFEVIGEASNMIGREFKSQHPEVEWVALNGFRNRLIHEYFGIDLRIVWDIIQDEIDPLLTLLSNIHHE